MFDPMKPASVVLLQCEARTNSLASSLSHYFRAVHMAHSADELREIIGKKHPQIAIIDVEVVGLSEVERLKRDFGGIPVVCTHRLADEEMWKEALDVGADDLDLPDDTRGIVAAAMRYAPNFLSVAA